MDCSAIWDAEEAQAIHAMMKRSTGHDCQGISGGQCPIMPKDVSPAECSAGLVVHTPMRV
jgi:hypothetical protein